MKPLYLTLMLIISQLNLLDGQSIRVNDTDFSKGRMGHIQEINLTDLSKFHGHNCDGLVESFLALQYGLYELFPDSIIDRTNLRIVSKASPCQADAAMYLTGGRYQYRTFYVDKDFFGLFIVQRIDNGRAISIRRNPGVKPRAIDSLGNLAAEQKLLPCQLDSLRQLEELYTSFLLNVSPRAIFQLVEIERFTWKPKLKNDFIKTDILNKDIQKCN